MLLDARDLVVRLGGRLVLEGASLMLEAGEVVGISGASGSGKSTFLRALALLTPLASGAIFLDGVDHEQLEPTAYRRAVGYVAQNAPMLGGTVANDLETGLVLAGKQLDRAGVARLLDEVGLAASFANRTGAELSVGERSRVALARALALEPSVLLVDEPTAPLDPTSATRVLELLKTRARGGLSVIVVTHVEAHLDVLDCRRLVCESGRIR